MTEPFLFTPRTKIQEALELDERVVQALKSLGLKCVDHRDEMCVAAAVETLSDASLYHNIPLDRILLALNELGLEKKPTGPEPEVQAP
jgi:hypothetical protein